MGDTTRMKHSVSSLKATQMSCVYETYLRLPNSSFCPIWARMNNAFITRSRLQSTQDGNLVKIFWWEEVWHFRRFSLVWVSMYQHSKSTFLLVTLNFVLDLSKRILVMYICTQLLLNLLTFIALQFLRKVCKASLWCVLLSKRLIYKSESNR